MIFLRSFDRFYNYRYGFGLIIQVMAKLIKANNYQIFMIKSNDLLFREYQP